MERPNGDGYFNRYRSKETKRQNLEEIERAIDKVADTDADIEIKKIWERVLK